LRKAKLEGLLTLQKAASTLASAASWVTRGSARQAAAKTAATTVAKTTNVAAKNGVAKSTNQAVAKKLLPEGGTVTHCMNPYKHPVIKDVMVVDPKGNIIPVLKNQRLTGSPDGKWIQVRDLQGKPTGLRPSPFSHKDLKALQPHAHVPNTINLDGTPWLPIN
jgi:hypothetical protein